MIIVVQFLIFVQISEKMSEIFWWLIQGINVGTKR